MIRNLGNFARIGWMIRVYKNRNNKVSTSAAIMAIQMRLLLLMLVK